jgi:hypothetical protein
VVLPVPLLAPLADPLAEAEDEDEPDADAVLEPVPVPNAVALPVPVAAPELDAVPLTIIKPNGLNMRKARQGPGQTCF